MKSWNDHNPGSTFLISHVEHQFYTELFEHFYSNTFLRINSLQNRKNNVSLREK